MPVDAPSKKSPASPHARKAISLTAICAQPSPTEIPELLRPVITPFCITTLERFGAMLIPKYQR